jgi:AcrR family transcriptional regulator
MPKVSEEYKKQKREEILSYAEKLFAEKGFRDTTVDDIAHAAGVSKGALYVYFKSKEEIFLGLLDDAMEKMLEKLQLAENVSAEDKLRRLVDFVQRIKITDEMKQKAKFQLETWLYLTREERFQFVLKKRWAQFKWLFQHIVEEGQEKGEFSRQVDAGDVATWFWALHDGLCLHSLIVVDQAAYDRTIELSQNMLWKTLKG